MFNFIFCKILQHPKINPGSTPEDQLTAKPLKKNILNAFKHNVKKNLSKPVNRYYCHYDYLWLLLVTLSLLLSSLLFSIPFLTNPDPSAILN